MVPEEIIAVRPERGRVAAKSKGRHRGFDSAPSALRSARTGSKYFRDRHDLHFVFGEREQGQIFLLHEQDEVMLTGKRQESAEQCKKILGDAGLPALNDGGGNSDAHWIS